MENNSSKYNLVSDSYFRADSALQSEWLYGVHVFKNHILFEKKEKREAGVLSVAEWRKVFSGKVAIGRKVVVHVVKRAQPQIVKRKTYVQRKAFAGQCFLNFGCAGFANYVSYRNKRTPFCHTYVKPLERLIKAVGTAAGPLGTYGEIIHQSGARLMKREEREEAQRAAAAARDKKAKLEVPKETRLKQVAYARMQRNMAKEAFLRQSNKKIEKVLMIGVGALGACAVNLVRSLTRTSDTAQEMLASLTAQAKIFKQRLHDTLWMAPFVAIIYFALRSDKLASCVYVRAAILSGLAVVLGKSVWSRVSKYFEEGDMGPCVRQSGFDGTLAKLFSTLMLASIFKRGFTRSTAGDLANQLSKIDRATGGWETFIGWIKNALEASVNWIRAMFGKDKVELFRSLDRPVKQWFSEVEEAVRVSSTCEVIMDPNEINRLAALVNRGHTFKELYRGTPMSRAVEEYLVKATNVLFPYMGSLNARNNLRVEPLFMMLVGDPGIGKTVMSQHICAAIMVLSGILGNSPDAELVKANVWAKGNSEYWQGYCGQACLIMDDAFQQKPNVMDKDNEYMNIIRMMSSWAFPLNFADLHSKGKIYFGSKFVLGTTNLKAIRAPAEQVIHEPMAAVRRISCPYYIEVKPEFLKQGTKFIDYDKYAAEKERCKTHEEPFMRYPWHIWRVFKHDFNSGVTSTEARDLSDVIREAALVLKQRCEGHAGNVAELDSFIEAMGQGEIQRQSGFFSRIRNAGDKARRVSTAHVKVMTMNFDKELRGKTYAERLEVLEDWMDNNLETNDFQWFVGWRKMVVLLMSAVLGYTLGLGLGKLVRFVFGAARHVLDVFFSATTALATGLWNFLCGIFGHKKKNEVVEQSNVAAVKGSDRPLQERIISQGVNSDVRNKIYGNTYKMYIDTPDRVIISGQVMFLEASLVLMPYHFITDVMRHVQEVPVARQGKIVIRNCLQTKHQVTFTPQWFLSRPRVEEPTIDAVVVNFVDDNGLPLLQAHRKVIHNFITEADLRTVSGKYSTLDVAKIDSNDRVVEGVLRTSQVVQPQYVTFPHFKEGEVPSLRSLKYMADTEEGDCGAPLCILDNSLYSGRSCMGFHVAKKIGAPFSYSTVITQEVLGGMIDKLKFVKDCFEEDLEQRGVKFESGFVHHFAEPGSFLPLFTLDKAVAICPVSSLFKTPHYGRFGPFDHSPAYMSPVRDPLTGVMQYPMENAVKPYSTEVLIYEQPWLASAMHVAMRPLTTLTKASPRLIYSFDEAVVGIPSEKFRSIPRGTSAGFPYVYTMRDGKKGFFGSEADYRLDGEKAIELRARVEHIIQEAKEGRRTSVVFMDFLKDELRKPEKIAKFETRLISASPLDYALAWRMYFGAFQTAVMSNHTRSGMCPGICPYSDWGNLAAHLRQFGDDVFDGDFKGFDSSEQAGIHNHILTYINRWYNDGAENCRVREVLWQDLVHSRHVGGPGKDQRFIYQWNKSLPSGHPFTTIVNSMYSLFCLVAAYIRVTGDLTGFWSNVRPATYGDDNVSGVSPAVRAVFNQQTVASALKEEFRLIYTPGDKTGNWTPFTNIENVTFLKRGFLFESGHWKCPLDKNSFRYMNYWAQNKKELPEILKNNYELMLQELSLYGEQEWSEMAPLVAEALEDLQHVSKLPMERGAYYNYVRSRTDAWY